jgi:hypothetical protein
MTRLLACVGLLLGFGLGLAACDRKWDFECTAVWTDDGKEVWRKVFTYPQMEDENAATARCKEEMLEARPRGANAAVCECKGIE